MNVWILEIHHKDGVEISAHHSEEGAYYDLHSYVEREWETVPNITEEFPEAPDGRPLENIANYFEEMLGAESYNITEVEIQP